MQAIRYILRVSWPCLLLAGMACGGAHTLPVSFTVARPPLLGAETGGTLACFGFTGGDIETGARVELHFYQHLKSMGRYTLIPPLDILNEMKQHQRQPGEMSDSLALVVGRRIKADVVILGQVDRTFTEQYQEEKKFRLAVYRDELGNQKVSEEAYWEAYVAQTARLEGRLRALDTATGREVGRDATTHSETFKIALQGPIQDAPKNPQTVERVDPRLLNKAAGGLAMRLVSSFEWHNISITRHIARGNDGAGQDGIDAIQNGDWDQARTTWERMVQESPDNPDAWNNLAIAYEQAGRIADARAAYDRALALRPDDPLIRQNKTGLP